MCIILMKPDTVDRESITKDTLYNCWQTNPHGAGIMVAHRGRMHVWKGLMTFAKFLDCWAMVPRDAVAVAHFRIATHGKRDESMTHPFWIKKNECAMVHNGILPIKAREQDGLSDTATFVEDVLKKLPADWMDNAATIHLIDGYAGMGNKLVFLTRLGRVLILNERAGTWDLGCWWSNGSYKRIVYANFETTPLLVTGRTNLRERWGKRKAKPKPDAHKDAAISIVTASRSRHKNDDDEVCRELGITKEELLELMLGQEDEVAIRNYEAVVENDRRESGKD